MRVNYVHYDPEMHWCQPCQVFPKTAKDFLTHLHSKEHQQTQKTLESPWHEQPNNDVSIRFLNIQPQISEIFVKISGNADI